MPSGLCDDRRALICPLLCFASVAAAAAAAVDVAVVGAAAAVVVAMDACTGDLDQVDLAAGPAVAFVADDESAAAAADVAAAFAAR